MGASKPKGIHRIVKRRAWTYIVPSNVTYCDRYHNTLHFNIICFNEIKMMHTFNIKTVLFVYSFSLDFAQWKEKCNIKVHLLKVLLIKRKNDFTQ